MKPEKINIAIAGFGNIGSYFYKILEKNKINIFNKTGKVPFVKYISARNINKKRLIKIPKSKWVKNPLNIPSMDNVDIVFELIGGSEGVAKKLVFSALKNKIHVITANKALMAKYGDQLAYLAEKNKVNLEYEASVAGGVPIIRSIKDGLIANKINKMLVKLKNTFKFIFMDPTNIINPKNNAVIIPNNAPCNMLFVDTKLAAPKNITNSIPSLNTEINTNINNPYL